MEDHQHVSVMIRASVFIIILFLVWPFFVFAYSTATHAALTDETIDFFNSYLPDKAFSDSEKENIKQGSIEEDAAPRWLRHFYDPIFDRGLKGIQLISKQWAKATFEQAGFAAVGLGSVNELFSAEDDYSWDRAIYEYTWGDRDRGLETLGHILHLIQDASVPDHTRNDPHPPVLDLGSPYEHWTKQFDDKSLDLSIELASAKTSIFENLDDYFESLALYSNGNFFSEDTILSEEYLNPAIVRFSDGFGFSEDNNFPLALKISKPNWTGEEVVGYTLVDKKKTILSNYWSRLSKQAVLHGAGGIKLFFDEVEKERKTKVLYNKNRSWAQKVFDATKNSIFNVASVFYGSSVTQADLEDDLETPFPSEQAEAVVIEQPSQQLSAEESVAETTIETSDLESDLAVKPPSEEPDEVLEEHEVNPDIQSPFSLVAIPMGAVGAGGGNNDVATNTASSASQTTTPQDTTSPDLIFSINECSNSLSFGCLSTSTMATLVWSSAASDLASYELSCTVGGAACAGFPKNFSATSSVSQNESLNDFTAYSFTLKATDAIGNQTSISREIETASRPVVINEVAWMGPASSTDDEWIELKNNTSQAINF